MDDHAAFLAFYEGQFEDELNSVEIPGMLSASWDRKAAWLLWLARGNKPPIDVDSFWRSVSALPAKTKMPWETVT